MNLTELDKDALHHREELFCQLREKLLEQKILKKKYTKFSKKEEKLRGGKAQELRNEIFSLKKIINIVIEQDIHPVEAKLQQSKEDLDEHCAKDSGVYLKTFSKNCIFKNIFKK